MIAQLHKDTTNQWTAEKTETVRIYNGKLLIYIVSIVNLYS